MEASGLSQTSAAFIQTEQVKLLFANAKASNLALMVVALVMTAALWFHIPHILLLGWTSIAFLTAGAWFILAQRYHQESLHEGNSQFWLHRALLAAGFVGTVWTSLPLLFLPYLPTDYRTFVIVIIVGRTAAAITTFAPVMLAFWISVIPTPLALGLMLLWQGDPVSLWLASLAALFIVLVIRSAGSINQTITGALQLQFSLQSEKKKADQLNANLTRRINERTQAENRLNTGVHVLLDSTKQIIHSLAQLLASTSEAATAVTQTATTIEEVKQTAHVTGQKAQHVSATAQQTASISQSGEQAADIALAGLQRAREQIESITQSVIRLGEHSQAIGEIIGTVNEFAAQSNLLAINAAIEAANAGEHGKGFAVVAQEVKRLAQQSQQATAQVQQLLQEIQKATHTAILVTEQGTRAIEVGISQSIESHHSIKTLVHSINDTSQAITQIVLSSQEQLIGMDQVAQAMVNVKQAARANVDGLRQIEKATQRLHEVGQTLKTLVEHSSPRTANNAEVAIAA